MTSAEKHEAPLFRAALLWAVFGVVYNVLEGIVSIGFGVVDDALTLLGFGVDSFIEAVSAIGIAVMVLRIARSPNTPRSRFESTALWITGWCFHLLAIGLLAGAGLNLWRGSQPTTTLPGVVISTISIAVMWIMLFAKLRIGRQLGSDAIVADARCTQVCIYMSIALLIASAIYQVTGIGYVDSFGAVAIAYFSYREGVESLEKAAGQHNCCDHGH